MQYRKQTMAMPTKNSAEEVESPTMCVVVTEWLQIVEFPSTSGTWLNLSTKQNARFKSIQIHVSIELTLISQHAGCSFEINSVTDVK